MPNSTTASNKTGREMLSVLRTTRDALFLRRRRSKEKQARRSNTHESTSSNFFDPDAAADRVIGKFLPEDDDDYYYYYECEQNGHHVEDNRNNNNNNNSGGDNDVGGRDFLDSTRYGGDVLAVPTGIMTYAPNPSATMTTTATFLSYGVQPLAPPAVSRRASMGSYYRPAYVSSTAVSTSTGGATTNRRGTVPPMGTSAAANVVKVGGYLSSTVDSLVVGHDPVTAGLDIDTSNHANHHQDHHQSNETYTFLIDHPPTTISTTGHHDDNKREEKRRNFEAMRKAEATRNPRFL